MPDRSRKRPTDASQLGKFIVDLSVGETEEPPIARPKNPAAVALGRLGGQKGGKARAEKLSARRRSQIAKAAALARYGKKP